MDSNTILSKLNEIFRDVLDNDAIKLELITTAKDIEEWDSLSHIQLVVAVEKHFKVRFTTQEIQNWKNVGDMLNSIENKMKK